MRASEKKCSQGNNFSLYQLEILPLFVVFSVNLMSDETLVISLQRWWRWRYNREQYLSDKFLQFWPPLKGCHACSDECSRFEIRSSEDCIHLSNLHWKYVWMFLITKPLSLVNFFSPSTFLVVLYWKNCS